MSPETRGLEAIDHPRLDHERSDVNVRAIFGFIAALLIVAIVIHVAVWGLFESFDTRQVGAPPHPMASAETQVPPEPRLQIAASDDLQRFRVREDAVLNGYQWVDREAGIVRIPIAEAMKLTVERGLPVRPATGEQQK